jgi:hypothetical protein
MNRLLRAVTRPAAVVCGVLVPVLFVASGCASSGGAASSARATDSSKPVNASCPMMPEHEVPQSGATTVVYKGQTVGFCCSDCVDGWTRLPDSEKDKALREAMAAR